MPALTFLHTSLVVYDLHGNIPLYYSVVLLYIFTWGGFTYFSLNVDTHTNYYKCVILPIYLYSVCRSYILGDLRHLVMRK